MPLPSSFRGAIRAAVWCALALFPSALSAQGVTTAAMSGFVTDLDGVPLTEAGVVAVHLPSGTQYRALSRSGGTYSLPNLRVGGPYRVTATLIGFKPWTEENVFLTGTDLPLIALTPMVRRGAGRDRRATKC
jgi:hypothetical protein